MSSTMQALVVEEIGKAAAVEQRIPGSEPEEAGVRTTAAALPGITAADW